MCGSKSVRCDLLVSDVGYHYIFYFSILDLHIQNAEL